MQSCSELFAIRIFIVSANWMHHRIIHPIGALIGRLKNIHYRDRTVVTEKSKMRLRLRPGGPLPSYKLSEISNPVLINNKGEKLKAS
jgi:hypothetical protein